MIRSIPSLDGSMAVLTHIFMFPDEFGGKTANINLDKQNEEIIEEKK